MPLFAVVAIALAALFGLVALWALGWSIATGQYRDFAAGARSIFDEEEPEGLEMDRFPSDGEHQQRDAGQHTPGRGAASGGSGA